MRLFEFSKESYEVRISEEVAILIPFKKILTRDKSKSKDMAIKELSFIYFYSDITSPYQGIIDLNARKEEIIKDIELPKTWKIDSIINDAIEFYKSRSKTAIHTLYDAAMTAVDAVNETLINSKDLIASSEDRIGATQKILGTLEKVPKVMQNLREAEKELIKQIEDNEGKKIGSKTFNTFEGGLEFD